MVTEWGTVEATGDGAVDRESTQEWLEFMAENDLTHLNWSVTDLQEGASILRTDASPNGGWPDSDLTESGLFVREIIRDWNACVEEDSVLLGDCNQDGRVDFLDISPFINTLSSGVFLAEADTNQDGRIDFLDISPFIVILAS